MLNLEDLGSLIRPLSTCPDCGSTDVEFRGVTTHLQISLRCKACGNPRAVVIMIGQFAKMDQPPQEEAP